MSGYGRPEENTLGTIIGKRGRPKPSSSPAARALRKASAGGASLGTGFLGIGAGVAAAIAVVGGLVLFLPRISTYPNVLPLHALPCGTCGSHRFGLPRNVASSQHRRNLNRFGDR